MALRRIWASIRRTVFAADVLGNPSYPKLQALWRSVDESGSTVHVEMPKTTTRNKAGEFRIETLDVEGGKHVLSIRLYVKVIDEGVACEFARRADGLIPFEGLSRVKRYAEVIGHELAHARCALKDPAYLKALREQDALNSELLSSLQHGGTSGPFLDAGTRSLMGRLERLVDYIEEFPGNAELEVWRELVSRCPTGSHPAFSADFAT